MWAGSTLRLPAVFGRYLLLHRISRGGMGEIFLARLGEIRGFEKPIIIKKLLPDLAQDREFMQKFIEEAQITIHLAHSNIAQVYEVGRVDGEHFLAMEYIEGRDLRSLGNRCQERAFHLPVDICLLLVREVANGLAYAHRRTDEKGRPLQLVHCDISPPNVLCSYEGEVKIIDFGIARSAAHRATEDSEVGFGKFGYMAPEQLIRGARVDRRADIYSTGVLLHELLTGRRLFQFPKGTGYREVARVVTAGKVDPPSRSQPGLSPELDRLVMRALHTRPEERFQSAEELRDAVQQQLYAMNPTISTDDLAAVMRRLFAEEQQASIQVRHLLSTADMESYRPRLTDAGSHTVSIALSDIWAGEKTPVASAVALLRGTPALPPPVPPAVRRPALPVEAAPPAMSAAPPVPDGLAVLPPVRDEGRAKAPEPSGSASTRKLTAKEQEAAQKQESEKIAFLDLSPVRERRVAGHRSSWLWGLAALSVLLVLGLATGALLYPWLPSPSDSPTPSTEVGAAPVSGVAPRPDTVDEDASVRTRSSEMAELGNAAAPTVDAGRARSGLLPDESTMDLVPVPARPPPGVRLTDRPRKPARTRGSRPRTDITAESVQRKFQSVRAEYERFTPIHGQVLDAEWQQILFTGSYGGADADRYRKLDALLNRFRRRMQDLRR